MAGLTNREQSEANGEFAAPESALPNGGEFLVDAASQVKSPFKFFLLVFVLSFPFWLIGAVSGLQLVPGLPASSLSAFSPVMAAAMLAYRENRAEGVTALLKKSFDIWKIKSVIWCAPIVLLAPGLMALSYGVMRVFDFPLPPPQFPIIAAPPMFLMFFVAALGEELGWSGYATDALQKKWSAFQAAVLLGVIGAAWHLVPLAQASRSPMWIAWWSVGSVAARVLTVWIYNGTGGSVFAAALFHAMRNISWLMFPNIGSHYDPRVVAPITAVAAGLVTLLWGSHSLTRRTLIVSGSAKGLRGARRLSRRR
jgi:membrane protease YdiL (CAAX protease family)